MGNPCGYGCCRSTDCAHCRHYTPTIFDRKIPKWLGNIGFGIEAWLLTINTRLERN